MSGGPFFKIDASINITSFDGSTFGPAQGITCAIIDSGASGLTAEYCYLGVTLDDIQGLQYSGVTKIRLSDLSMNPTGIYTFLEPGPGPRCGFTAVNPYTPYKKYGYFASKPSTHNDGYLEVLELDTMHPVQTLPLGTCLHQGCQIPTCAVTNGPYPEYAYIGTSNDVGYADAGIIIKVKLRDPGHDSNTASVFGKILQLNSGENNLSCVIIDSGGTYGYFGTNPGFTHASIIKVLLNDSRKPGTMTRVTSLPLAAALKGCRSAIMDKNGKYGYFGVGDNPGEVVTVRLSDMSMVDVTTLNLGEAIPYSAITDGVHGWFGTGPPDASGNIVKLQLGDGPLTNLGSVVIPAISGMEITSSVAVIGPSGNYGYFGVGYGIGTDITGIPVIMKVGLGTGTYDISDTTSWIDACIEYNEHQTKDYNHYLLTNDITLNVSDLSGGAPSKYFYEFGVGATFDGSGYHLTLDGAGTTDIDMSLFKDLQGGTIQNFTFDISGCTSLESNKGFLVGTDAVVSSNTYGDISGVNVNPTNNSTVVDAGGYMVGSSFGYQTTNNIIITNCNFTGDVSGGSDKGGLFGAYLFHEASGNNIITIQDCDISGNVNSYEGGGITGRYFGKDTNPTTIKVLNCSFKGDVLSTNAGGLLGAGLLYNNLAPAGGFVGWVKLYINKCSFEGTIDGSGSGGIIGSSAINSWMLVSARRGEVTIENCDISAVISGYEAGGMFGVDALINSDVATTIASNTFNVDLQGENTAAMFGYNMLNGSANVVLKIGLPTGPNTGPNTITIHDVNASVQTAGIGVIAVNEHYNNGGLGLPFDVVTIKYNTIKSGATLIPFENFGGIFDVSSATLSSSAGGVLNSHLIIELNDFTNLNFTSLPLVHQNYLFNDAGIEYFNNADPDIFLTNTINNNSYGHASNIFDISNISSWQAACTEWNDNGDLNYAIFHLVTDTTLLEASLNELPDTSNNFNEFTASFNGQGVHTLTLDGTGSTDISKSLFMDLSGGTIYGLTLDLSNNCTTTDRLRGFLVGKSISTFVDYGNFHDISVNNLDSSSNVPLRGGYMVGGHFGQATDASINITNCNFTGNVAAENGGGLFGWFLYNNASGNLIISNCDFSGNVESLRAGGLTGSHCGYACQPQATIDIGNCTFTGEVNATQNAGGLFGERLFYEGEGNITIQDCSINATIDGSVGCNGGLGGQLCFYANTADASINILNCNFTGEVAGADCGGLFGAHCFQQSQGDIIIKDCDISGIVSGAGAGGLGGDNNFITTASTMKADVSHCTFTGDISGDNAGGLFGAVCFQNADGILTIDNCSSTGNVSGIGSGGLCGYQLGVSCEGILTIDNCSSTGNVSGPGCGGIAGSSAFYDCSGSSTINIISNQFNGSIISDNSANGSGGLFGSHFYNQGKGTLTISGCHVYADISGSSGGAGGLIGSNSHETSAAGHTTTITKCLFQGTIGSSTAESCGGFFGENLCSGGGGTFIIQDCHIHGPSGNISDGLMGKNCGGIAPCDSSNNGPFSNALPGTTIDICGNTIKLNIQGADSGGIFGPNMLADASNITLNIKNNFIAITSADVSGAGIAVYDLAAFDNRDNSVNIIDNTIRTINNVPPLNFGGVFYVNNGDGLVTTDGSGTLTVTGNNLSGITFSSDVEHPNNYLFNTDGMPFFDGTPAEIFQSLDINNNTFGSVYFDISNITSWEAACVEWDASQDTIYNHFRLIADTSLNVLALNALGDGSNNFNTFGPTFHPSTVQFDGCGNTLTMDGSGSTDISNSLFMDLSGGTIQDFRFDISECITLDPSQGFLVGISGGSTGDYYGNLRDIDVHNIGSVATPVLGYGGYMVGQYFGRRTSNTIEIANCNFTGDVSGISVGGLFGANLFDEASGNIVIENCDICGNIIGTNAGGIGGRNTFQGCTTDASINVTNCNFTGNVSGIRVGGLFGDNLLNQGAGDITIQDCDISGNIIGGKAGGIAGEDAFTSCTADASINITNCNFTGDVSGSQSGGLFGNDCFSSGQGDITIQDCDISGIVSGQYAGGIAGQYAFSYCKTDASINITTCNFTGDVSGSQSGGLFGFALFTNGEGDITIQNCDISGNVSGQQTGGITGQYPFYNAKSTSTIDICNNTISVNLQGAESGGLFGSRLMESSEATLNITNNTITITGIDVSNAGISVYESGGFTNNDCSVNVINNTIQTTTSVASADFGGIFFVNSGTIPDANDGSGNLTITGNDLSGIIISGGAPTQNNYLFNTAGIPFFDTSLHNKIFLTNTLNPNTYGFVNYFDIFNLTTWQAACEEWNVNQDTNIGSYRLISDTSLNVLALNALGDGSNNFTTFTSTFDGSGHTLTLDGSGAPPPTKSLFMDLSGGTIHNFRFDISDCTQGSANRGYLVGESVFLSTVAYGNFYDININNLGSTSVTSGGFMGGRDFGRSLLSSRTIDISNCNFIGDVNTSSAAGLFGTSFGFGAEGNINITNCDFTGDVTNTNAGGLFGVGFGQSIDGNITIQNCDVSGNITGQQAGGIAGRSAVKDCTAAASITITNCNFTGDVTRTEAGGLFGNDFFETGAGDITIQNCDFSGNITNTRAGGITGSESFKSCTIDASINITNCNFTGNVTNTFSGGLFGFDFFNSGAGDITIQNCSINGTISGSDAGGIAGGGAGTGPFIHATSSATININNNTIDVDLQGTNSGALFGSQLMEDSNATLNILNNTITITSAVAQTAGISTYETGAFDNSSCTVNITNNTIQTLNDVSGTEFGGVFYVNSATAPDVFAGKGALTITGNNFSGINFLDVPPSSNSYLFNTDGIRFFDDTPASVLNPKIFLTNILNPNTYGPLPPGPPTPPSTRDFSGYSYLLQWIYTNALTALSEQTWFESYALYLPREQVMR